MGMEQIKALLTEMKSIGVEAAAIVLRNGVPVVYDGIEGAVVETYATLSATIVGASEVIYSTLGKAAPRDVIIRSSGAIFVGIPLSNKAIFAAVVRDENMLTKLHDYVKKLQEVLSSG